MSDRRQTTKIDIVIALILLIAALYFFAASIYYMTIAMPASSFISLFIGIILILSWLHVYTLLKEERKDDLE